jgi:hypothetical protein
MRPHPLALLALATGVLASGGCSGPPPSSLAALKTADSGAIIDCYAGVEYTVPLPQSEAQHLVKAAASGKLRGKNLLWTTSSLIRFYKGTNIVGEIPFNSDGFWLNNAVYRDETCAFEDMQSRLRLAKPATNAAAR